MPTEPERLDQLLAMQERTISRAIREYLAIINSEAVAAVIQELLEKGQAEQAIQLLATYVNRIGDAIPSIWQEVGQDAADQFPKLLPTIAVGIGFDVTFPRAADLIRQSRLNFITNFNDSQRQSVRQALARSAMLGTGIAEIAREFRDAIGLAPVQEQAVANYRRLLENGSADALDRALRDRRFDRTVAGAIEADRPLNKQQIDRMVARYRARALAMRTETIARTEALDAFNQAREEALRQMVDQTGIPRENVIRVWHSTRDQRTRDWHESMQGQERGITEPFEDGKGNLLMRPGDRSAPPETTINCRCTVTFRIKKAA